MEPDDLLCSRNARPQKDREGAARCPSCSQNAHCETVLVTRATCVRYGMKPFWPNAKQTLKTDYEVPVGIIEDTEQLTTWAARAVSGK